LADEQYGIFTNSLTNNVQLIKAIFSDDDTVMTRFFESEKSRCRFCVIYLLGMVKINILNDNIIKPMMNFSCEADLRATDLASLIINKILPCGSVKKTDNTREVIDALTYGSSLLLVDDCREGIIIASAGWDAREIEEPPSETVIKGPREGFNESLVTNLTLIRRRLRTEELKFKFREIGERTRTKICICYLEGIARPEILEELEKRLDQINIDGVLDSQYIEEYIQDEPFSPFKTIGYTERPDTVAGKLLEGRIAIVCDGTTGVLTLPFLFLEYFQPNEDYYQNYLFSSLNRLLRILGFFLTTSVPAIYVALITYHQEMLPTDLLISIYQAREGIPLPTTLEAIGLGLGFQLLREAGIRLPKPLGLTISFIGALVIGQSIVGANFVSAPIIIVTVITAITGLSLPLMAGAQEFVRLIFIIVSSILGLYGYIFSAIALLLHFAAMKSFGVPYLTAVIMDKAFQIEDTAVRTPWWYMNFRTRRLALNLRRQSK
jgi:spore germination protein KA